MYPINSKSKKLFIKHPKTVNNIYITKEKNLVSDVQGTYHAFHLRQIHIAQHVNRNQIVRVNDKANVIVKVGVNAIYD